MDILISWSGPISLQVATALKGWIRGVINDAHPWMSEEDIEKGARWRSNLSAQLRTSKFCIVCLTPDNLRSEWIHFEVGAVSEKLDPTKVCPYLHGLGGKSVLMGPLADFQYAESTKIDTFKVIQSINSALGDRRLPAELLARSFELNWPILESRLGDIDLGGVPEPGVRPEDVLEEVVERVRRVESGVASLQESLSTASPTNVRAEPFLNVPTPSHLGDFHGDEIATDADALVRFPRTVPRTVLGLGEDGD